MIAIIRFKKLDGGKRRFKVEPAGVTAGGIAACDNAEGPCEFSRSQYGFCTEAGAYPLCRSKIVFKEIEHDL